MKESWRLCHNPILQNYLNDSSENDEALWIYQMKNVLYSSDFTGEIYTKSVSIMSR
jgi:hypothetical protein